MKNLPTSLAARRGPAVIVLLVGRLHLGVAALLLITAPLLACSPAGINGLRSQVRIDVGKQFELGGGQLLGFRVEADNAGPVAVEIKEKTSDGRIRLKGTLQPGQKTTASFGFGSKAVLVNLGQREAKVDVNISGGSGLSMGYAPAQTSRLAASPPRLSGSDLSSASANDWRGTLTYRDYGTGKSVRLNTAMRGQMPRADQLILAFDYEEPNKSHVFGADTLAVGSDGTRLRWDGTDFAVIARQRLPDQTLRLVLEGQGRDNDQPATIRKILTLSPRQFTLQKEVRYESGIAFFQRHHYQFTR